MEFFRTGKKNPRLYGFFKDFRVFVGLQSHSPIVLPA